MTYKYTIRFNSIQNMLSNAEDIPFDENEWLIRDTNTNRIRPPKLIEFLHLLLNNLRYLSYISWLNKNEGLFQIHDPEQVAHLWSQVKSRHTNNSMTFETFSRGIRYYYKNGSMLPTHTKYTYRFAINETDF